MCYSKHFFDARRPKFPKFSHTMDVPLAPVVPISLKWPVHIMVSRRSVKISLCSRLCCHCYKKSYAASGMVKLPTEWYSTGVVAPTRSPNTRAYMKSISRCSSSSTKMASSHSHTVLLLCQTLTSCCLNSSVFSKRAVCCRPSVCLSVCRLSICRLSICCLSVVTVLYATQPVEILGNVSTPFCTLAIH